MFLWIAAGVAGTVYQTRKQRPLERIIEIVAAACVLFAWGQAAAFHLGTQAVEWTVVSAVLIVGFTLLYGLVVFIWPGPKAEEGATDQSSLVERLDLGP